MLEEGARRWGDTPRTRPAGDLRGRHRDPHGVRHHVQPPRAGEPHAIGPDHTGRYAVGERASVAPVARHEPLEGVVRTTLELVDVRVHPGRRKATHDGGLWLQAGSSLGRSMNANRAWFPAPGRGCGARPGPDLQASQRLVEHGGRQRPVHRRQRLVEPDVSERAADGSPAARTSAGLPDAAASPHGGLLGEQHLHGVDILGAALDCRAETRLSAGLMHEMAQDGLLSGATPVVKGAEASADRSGRRTRGGHARHLLRSVSRRAGECALLRSPRRGSRSCRVTQVVTIGATTAPMSEPSRRGGSARRSSSPGGRDPRRPQRSDGLALPSARQAPARAARSATHPPTPPARAGRSTRAAGTAEGDAGAHELSSMRSTLRAALPRRPSFSVKRTWRAPIGAPQTIHLVETENSPCDAPFGGHRVVA